MRGLATTASTAIGLLGVTASLAQGNKFLHASIHDIQGPSLTCAHPGTLVTVRGVVTGTLSPRHFWVSAPTSEWDVFDSTSEGIMVQLESATPEAQWPIGTELKVSGVATEARESYERGPKDLLSVTTIVVASGEGEVIATGRTAETHPEELAVEPRIINGCRRSLLSHDPNYGKLDPLYDPQNPWFSGHGNPNNVRNIMNPVTQWRVPVPGLTLPQSFKWEREPFHRDQRWRICADMPPNNAPLFRTKEIYNARPFDVVEDIELLDQNYKVASHPSTRFQLLPKMRILDFWEALEGMLVRIVQPRVISTLLEGQFQVVSHLGEFTDRAYVSPRGALIHNVQPHGVNMNPQIITIAQPPDQTSWIDPSVGDFLDDIVGVVHYRMGNFVVYPRRVPGIVKSCLMESTSPTSIVAHANNVVIASYNVENWEHGTHGRKTARLAEHIVEKLRSPDILALEEVMGYVGPLEGKQDRRTAEENLQELILAILALDGPRYSTVVITPELPDADGGMPGSNIQTVLLYNPARVTLAPSRHGAGNAIQPVSVLPGDPECDPRQLTNCDKPSTDYNPGRISPGQKTWIRTRKSFVTVFDVAGGRGRLYLCANHLSSKLGGSPRFGRRQPPSNSREYARREQAAIVKGFASTILLRDSSAKIVILGDFNEVEFAPPLLELSAGGQFSHLATIMAVKGKLSPNQGYTYIFNGQAQMLDHAFISPSLHERSTMQIVHLNTHFPRIDFESTAPQLGKAISDHDPIILAIATPERHLPRRFVPEPQETEPEPASARPRGRSPSPDSRKKRLRPW